MDGVFFWSKILTKITSLGILKQIKMNSTSREIGFVPFHKPNLKSGAYKIKITQEIEHTGAKKIDQTYISEKQFHIAGERFQINPNEIQAVFPAPHSLGDYSSSFPHLICTRNTLPWEREIELGDSETPWLALLVVNEGEEATITHNIVTLGSLVSDPLYSGFQLEQGQKETDKVKVMILKKELLQKIIPDKNTLRYMTHSRSDKSEDSLGNRNEVTVLVGNRLPSKGKRSTVYLVSLENRFKNGTFDYPAEANADTEVSLINLYSWQFTSSEHFRISASFLHKASDLPQTIKDKLELMEVKEFFTQAAFEEELAKSLTATELNMYRDAIFKDFSYGDFTNILKHLDRKTETLRLPDTNNTLVNTYLEKGFYPIAHKMRQGEQSIAWYHGPLGTSGQVTVSDITFPISCSDQLLQYYDTQGMFDISYAAAWELGRLMALQNNHFSTELYQWKRRYNKWICNKEQHNKHDTHHLNQRYTNISNESLPDSLQNWLTDLEYLKGVPFSYIIPDEQLLPVESIRFFTLDTVWVHCLLDGALSIGRVSSKDYALDEKIHQEEELLTSKKISGFILRSEIVSGWPRLQIEGYDSQSPTPNKLSILRKETLSDNVLLVLFDGEIKEVDLHLTPESLHFGVEVQQENGKVNFKKSLRSELGEELDAHTISIDVNTDNVITISEALLNAIKTEYEVNPDIKWSPSPSSADFAVQWIKGVEGIRFKTN